MLGKERMRHQGPGLSTRTGDSITPWPQREDMNFVHAPSDTYKPMDCLGANVPTRGHAGNSETLHAQP